MSQSLMSTFTLLAIPVPPMLEAAFGYPRHARWVAFYWEPCGDELRYHDGAVSADGSWQAWLTFVRHRRIAPALAPYHFGNSEEEAVHWLLLDCATRTLLAGASADVARFLRQSASPLMTSEALTVLLATMRAHVSTPHDLQVVVAHAMRREHNLVTALTEWLDTR
jgi:hypothetical protein